MEITAFFGVVDPLGIGDARRLFSERLRQAFMKPWFAWVNIIAKRYIAPPFMQNPGSELPRIRLPRTRVDTFRTLLDARLEELKGLLEG